MAMVICRWCQAAVAFSLRTCQQCGHNPHVPRGLCDCGRHNQVPDPVMTLVRIAEDLMNEECWDDHGVAGAPDECLSCRAREALEAWDASRRG